MRVSSHLCNAGIVGVLCCLPASPCRAQTVWSSFSGRTTHAMACDPNTQTVVMFGGQVAGGTSSSTYLGDTWELEAPNLLGEKGKWVQKSPTFQPTPRGGHSICASTTGPDASVTVMFGGITRTGTGSEMRLDETLLWGAGGWTPADPASKPSARNGHGMVWDDANSIFVMFGGDSGTSQQDTWTFDSSTTTWTLLNPVTKPAARTGHAMTYDEGSGTVLMFGGTQVGVGASDETWQWDGVNWTLLNPVTKPPARTDAAMVYYTNNGSVVLFGGIDSGGTALDDTWQWNGISGTWTDVTPVTPSPSARCGHAIAMDDALNFSHRTVVMMGGVDDSGEPALGTWDWDGSDWTERGAPPQARLGAAMAYDTKRNVTVMFGGQIPPNGGNLGDTWELENSNWENKAPGLPRPSARRDHSMAYHAKRDRTMLFGGLGGLVDTWEWNGSAWASLSPVDSPPASVSAPMAYHEQTEHCVRFTGGTWLLDEFGEWDEAMLLSARQASAAAYDSTRDEVVLFGGLTAGGTDGETWVWDGLNWHVREVPGPDMRQDHAMAYDSANDQVVLFGGRDGATNFNDTWVWNGTSWTELSPAGSLPSERYGHRLAYDAANDQVVLFGGFEASGPVADTWVWNGSTWTDVSPGTSPSVRGWHTMAYDSQAGEVVLFGGRTSVFNIVDDDTWVWDGAAWTDVSPPPAASPLKRQDAAMTYIGAGQTLLFGGNALTGGIKDDTWIWDGSAWTEVSPATIPSPARKLHVLAHHAASNHTLLFGGVDSSPSNLADTWTWDTSDWTLVSKGDVPAARTHHGMAYDPKRQSVLMFGGEIGGAVTDELWEWNGYRWDKTENNTNPTPRARAHVSYDVKRARLVVFGGDDGTPPPNTLSDTWEWDGDDWISRSPVLSPPGMQQHAATYDELYGLNVIFGDDGGWEYGPLDPASHSVASGTPGCATPPQPTLVIDRWEGAWIGCPFTIRVENTAATSGFMILGTTITPIPLSAIWASNDCTILVNLALAIPFSKGAFTLNTPNTPALVGLPLLSQALVVDPGRPIGVTMSDVATYFFGAK